jgi:hypothetical protein
VLKYEVGGMESIIIVHQVCAIAVLATALAPRDFWQRRPATPAQFALR